ncbi:MULTISPECIES: hypothetical protein [unclassified Polaribacter]|uniref:hypothetical protein n=1 Tax=unclassified Polaribacter TaxID=196858 RepID=UPI0011BFC2ED|nr:MULTISPECIES: hypothetical protein [unclassified Polaribacter]TXD51790.1 hypothetical protein ES043_10325 [Polaribacter sp. IC063]TXD59152.1 hypothetical protein ES044_10400 [Polaribacter sp. IC066]
MIHKTIDYDDNQNRKRREPKKTNFLNLDELIDYLLTKEGYGILHAVDKNKLTSIQKKRIDTALKTEKYKMLNI